MRKKLSIKQQQQDRYYSSGNNNSISKISPYSRFIYALNAPESKRQYPTRFQVYLDFLKIDGLTIEEKANKFYDLIIANGGREWLESQLIGFFTLQNSRVEKGEISAGTIKNYYKPIKLFCEMNNVLVNWKFISRGIKKGSENAEDRPPSIEEIKKLMEYPDRRMKPIVLTMISSGIRIGSWDYLKWKHIIPKSRVVSHSLLYIISASMQIQLTHKKRAMAFY